MVHQTPSSSPYGQDASSISTRLSASSPASAILFGIPRSQKSPSISHPLRLKPELVPRKQEETITIALLSRSPVLVDDSGVWLWTDSTANWRPFFLFVSPLAGFLSLVPSPRIIWRTAVSKSPFLGGRLFFFNLPNCRYSLDAWWCPPFDFGVAVLEDGSISDSVTLHILALVHSSTSLGTRSARRLASHSRLTARSCACALVCALLSGPGRCLPLSSCMHLLLTAATHDGEKGREDGKEIPGDTACHSIPTCRAANVTTHALRPHCLALCNSLHSPLDPPTLLARSFSRLLFFFLVCLDPE